MKSSRRCTEWRGMTRFQRAILYSGFLVALLGAVSVLFYRLPSQVERRVRDALAASLASTDTVELRNCRAGGLGEVAVDEILVPAAPKLGEGPLLRLHGVRSVVDALAAGRARSTEVVATDDAPRQWYRIDVERLELSLVAGRGEGRLALAVEL